MYDAKNFRLDDNVALITGAGAGIGRAIALTYAGAGAAVMVSDYNADAAAGVAAEIKAAGGRAVSMVCDVTKEDDLADAVAKTVVEFGKLTLLVSNAGGGGPNPLTCRWLTSNVHLI